MVPAVFLFGQIAAADSRLAISGASAFGIFRFHGPGNNRSRPFMTSCMFCILFWLMWSTVDDWS